MKTHMIPRLKGNPVDYQHSLLGGQRGQSIIQILISVGLMGIVTMAFSSMMANQWRETRALTEKLAASDLQQLLTASLADGSVCAYVLNNPSVLSFDSTMSLPQTINLTNPTAATAALYSSMIPNPAAPPATIPGPAVARVGQLASPASSSLVVESIQLKVVAGSGSAYSGYWQVNFDPMKTIRSIRPVLVQTTLAVDTTTPSAAKITGCGGNSGGGGGSSGLGDMVQCTTVGIAGGTIPNPPCAVMSDNPCNTGNCGVVSCSPGWVPENCIGGSGLDCCIRVQ